MFKFLGLALVLVSWLAGAYMIKKWRGDRSMTISKHAASADGASRLFAFVLIVGGSGSYIWLIKWFALALKLPDMFIILVTLAFVGQIVSALIPDTDAWKSKVHRSAAYGMAFLYLPMSYYILVASSLTLAARVVGLVCAAYMLTASLLFFLVKRAQNHYLIFQALYIVAFQVIILSAAYIT